MSRYERSFKLELAKRAQEESRIELSRTFKVSLGQIKYWSSVYQLHGLKSFLHSEYPYSFTFKMKVLAAMRNNNWSLAYTSAFFDLSTPGVLFQWQRLYSLEGVLRLRPRRKRRPRMKKIPCKTKPSEKMTEAELREELDYLRAENAVLKKLEALAQEKKKRAKIKL